MNVYYDCKTCGQPYGFGRVTLEPAECDRCDPPPPYYVTEPSDFELGEAAERERIIKLWDQEMKCECEDPMRHLLTLIKGEK